MSSAQESGNHEGRAPTRGEDPTGENRLPSMFSGGDFSAQGGAGSAPETKPSKCNKKNECGSVCGGCKISNVGWVALGLVVLIGVRIYRNQTAL